MEGAGQGQSFSEETLYLGASRKQGPPDRTEDGTWGEKHARKVLIGVGPEEGGAYRAGALLGTTGRNLLT